MEDSIYRLRARDVLALCVFGLLALGVVMVQSAATSITGDTTWSLGKTGTRHVIYVGVALVLFFVVGHLDYRRLFNPFFRKPASSPLAAPLPASEAPPLAAEATQSASGKAPAPAADLPDAPPPKRRPGLMRQILTHPVGLIYLAGFLCCLVVLVPGIGREVNGARRWLVFGPIQLQASEAGKWACVIFYAWLLSARPLDLSRFRNLVLATLPLGMVALLVVKEDFGTAALISLCCLTMIIVGGARLWHFGIVLPPLAAAAYWFVRHKEYRWKRVIAFMHPFDQPQKEGYHLIQSLLSFATGGIVGRGLGNGLQKLGYLPEDTTDFIFAIICEELGLFGAMLTVALYLGILWAAWQIIRSCSNTFGRTLAFGVSAMIGLQALINIAVATVSVPPKGLPLPLVSFGGSGLLITSAALGLVYSIGRTAEKESTSVR